VFHYRLRTLLILLAVGPPMLAAPEILRQKAAAMRQANHEKQLQLRIFMNSANATARLGLPMPAAKVPLDDIAGPGSIDQFQATGCYVIDVEGDPDAPDPCGRSYSFTPYSEYSALDNEGFLLVPFVSAPHDDPFAVVK
jgi:hypothetical protein